MKRLACLATGVLLAAGLLLPSPAAAVPLAPKAPIAGQGDFADKSRPLVITPALTDYCRLLYGCGLRMPAATCPSREELGPSPFAYDDARCSEARDFSARGIGPDHPFWGFRLYRFLGAEYRVVYEVTDTLPISRERLEYLIGDIPLSARLISHYQKDKNDEEDLYTATYVDAARTHFKGTKGKHLRGEAKILAGSFAERRLYYMGNGVADVAFWSLTGPAMMDFSYWEIPGGEKKVGYRLKILVFPGNGMVNTIMNLGLFRGLVISKIKGVLTDISETAQKLKKDNGKSVMWDPQWTAAEKKKTQTLLQLP